MAPARAGNLAGVIPEQELIKPRSCPRQQMRAARFDVVDEDALIQGDFFVDVTTDTEIRVTGIVANAVWVSDRFVSAFANQRLVAIVDTIPVAFILAIQTHSFALVSPGTPEADMPAVKCDALAESAEAAIDGPVGNRLPNLNQGLQRWLKLQWRQVDAS